MGMIFTVRWQASEIFIHELSLRAWSHAELNKRRTLQKNDIESAVTSNDSFDFLVSGHFSLSPLADEPAAGFV